MHVTAQTLSPCYNANLTLTSDQLTSAAGCTVVFYPPDLNDSPEVVHWTYRNADSPSLSIIVYFKEQSKVDLYHSYAGRVNFSKTNWTLQIKLQLEDEGMYQFRTNSQESKWFLLEVIDPSTLAVSVAVAVVAVVVIAILAIVGYKRGFFQRCFSEDSDIRSRKSINWEN
nr:uncharacterized protein LOC106731632 isoform X2 [Pelodiscus sinensis]|eukprot:XP_025037923.1 uncharacterized protein LOC106731632 isoform X2 [Pelodiscus sinensis]